MENRLSSFAFFVGSSLGLAGDFFLSPYAPALRFGARNSREFSDLVHGLVRRVQSVLVRASTSPRREEPF